MSIRSVHAARPIALALSGGGIRAMVFHLGVLRGMAERGLLEEVSHVSTVSGGSLLVGLLLCENAMQWPSSRVFLDKVYPALRLKLTQKSLQLSALRQLIQPRNWRYLLTRANLLALALTEDWQITGRLADVPTVPEWSINGTTAEDGKRFRFKAKDIGDYTLGYASPGELPLAEAMAVSSAFPVGFGPLALETAKFDWRKREWDAPEASAESTRLESKTLHLYDGGIYDNLGLEPFFDAGRGVAKHADSRILVSDAGAPLMRGFAYGPFSFHRLLRVADIMADQAHALRVRTFAAYVADDRARGNIYSINTPVSGDVACASQAYATCFPTTLRRLGIDEFDRLADHAWKVFMKNEPRKD